MIIRVHFIAYTLNKYMIHNSIYSNLYIYVASNWLTEKPNWRCNKASIVSNVDILNAVCIVTKVFFEFYTFFVVNN